MRDEAHVRLVDAHAEGDRGHHDQPVLAQEPRLVRCAGSARPARRGRAGRAMPSATRNAAVSLHRGRATGSRRCPRRPACSVAQQPQQLPRAARSSARSGSWMFGRSKLATKCRASPSASRAAISARVAAVAVAVTAIRGTVGPALVQHGQRQVVGAEIVPPLGHAVRLVDGEQRDRAAVQQPQRATRCAAAPAPGRAGRACRRGRRTRRRAASSGSWVEFRKPARTPSSAQRVDLVLHERDQRRDDHAGARPGTSAGIW